MRYFLTAILFSVTSCMPSFAKTGLYAGINFGKTNLITSLNRDLAVLTNDSTISLGRSANSQGVCIGYDHTFTESMVYLGGEVSYQYRDLSIIQTENTFPGFVEYTTNLSTKGAVGFAVKLGLAPHKNFLAYVKAGSVISNFRAKFSDRTAPFRDPYNKSFRKVGFQTGVGIDYAFAENWRAGLEYEWVQYPTVRLDCGHVGSLKFKPETHNINIGIKYVF